MTAVNKRIKTVYKAYKQTLAAGDGGPANACNLFVPQEDITLIGFQISSLLYFLAELDSGYINIWTEVSRIGVGEQDGSLGKVRQRIEGRSVTVGIGSTEVVVGKTTEEKLFWFPPGYGIDFNEGEPIYLNMYGWNDMANDHDMGGDMTLYYVER